MAETSFKTIQTRTFFIALLGASVLFAWMLRTYIYPIFWAAVIAGLFHPLYNRILQKVKRPGTAATLTELIILFIVMVPLAAVVSLLIQQAFSVYNTFGNRETFISFNQYIQQTVTNPLWAPYLERIDITDKLSSFGSSASAWLYSFLTRSGQNTARWAIQLIIMLYTLYFFLKDGKAFLKRLMHILPLGDVYELRLYERFVSTTRATLKGTVVIGILQGSIGTIALVITGVPAPVFWGVVMIVLSIIPGIGASVVLLPTTIVLLILGQWWQAAVVFVALVFAGTIDNVIRGPLVGKDTQMHPLLIFFATLGGLLSFGISGVVIGPVITALFLSLWQIYEEKYHQDLVKAG